MHSGSVAIRFSSGRNSGTVAVEVADVRHGCAEQVAMSIGMAVHCSHER